MFLFNEVKWSFSTVSFLVIILSVVWQILSKNDHSGLDRIFKRYCFQWQLFISEQVIFQNSDQKNNSQITAQEISLPGYSSQSVPILSVEVRQTVTWACNLAGISYFTPRRVLETIWRHDLWIETLLLGSNQTNRGVSKPFLREMGSALFASIHLFVEAIQSVRTSF